MKGIPGEIDEYQANERAVRKYEKGGRAVVSDEFDSKGFKAFANHL